MTNEEKIQEQIKSIDVRHMALIGIIVETLIEAKVIDSEKLEIKLKSAIESAKGANNAEFIVDGYKKILSLIR